ncbi:MAG TPA: hypothetical protein PLG73_15100 [Candidatus Sumerlaeota bacterium]|nr:hypothetical protein [Candidatus Sumerlaeota bacterium]
MIYNASRLTQPLVPIFFVACLALTLACGPAGDAPDSSATDAGAAGQAMQSPTADSTGQPDEGAPAPDATPADSADPATSPATPQPSTERKYPPFVGDNLTTEAMLQHLGEPGVGVIAWKTQSEENNFGFNVLRSENEEGPFVKVNRNPILGAGNSSTENRYVYYDKTVKIGDVYSYYLESISMGGVREQFSPVITDVIRRPYYAELDDSPPVDDVLPEGLDEPTTPATPVDVVPADAAQPAEQPSGD